MCEEQDNCDALYWKGRVLKETGKVDDAVQIYEQAITLNRSQNATLSSIYDLTVIRILDRDIYLAYYTLDRVENIPEEQTGLCQLLLFLNGAVNMLKRKFQDGLAELEKIALEKLRESELVKLVHSYRAYGLFSLDRVVEALGVYNLIEEQQWMKEGDRYNKLLCQGIILGQEKRFEEAQTCFEEARQMFMLRVEPTFYLCVAYPQLASTNI